MVRATVSALVVRATVRGAVIRATLRRPLRRPLRPLQLLLTLMLLTLLLRVRLYPHAAAVYAGGWLAGRSYTGRPHAQANLAAISADLAVDLAVELGGRARLAPPAHLHTRTHARTA